MTRVVGVIGVGNMGAAMARNLLAHGYAVHVHDIDPAQMQPLRDLGAVVHDSSFAVAQSTQLLIISVVNALQVDQVLAGELGLDQALTPDHTVVLCPTISPTEVERFAQQIQAEWLVNLGRKNAMERLAHLLCEMYCRLSMSGHVSGTSCEMPLTQLDLADLAGLTPVHVNRTLQEMRAMHLIELQSRRLTILDWAAMRRIAWFDPQYLGFKIPAERLQAAA